MEEKWGSPSSFFVQSYGKGQIFTTQCVRAILARAADADDAINYAQQGCAMQNRGITLSPFFALRTIWFANVCGL